MKKRYWSLTLAGLLWALGSTGAVQGDLVQGDLVQGDLLDRVEAELKSSGTICNMGLEFEPNG